MESGEVRIERLPLDRLDDLIDAQNEIFADYIIPMRVTRQFFLDFLRSVGGRLSRVLIALDGKRIVGYVNPVVDGREAWIGGIGVVPDMRSKGLGQRLMMAAEEACAAEGVQEISLEVVVGNERAHELYKRIGYRDSRKFISVEGRPERFVDVMPKPEKASMSDLLELHERTYQDSCWQKRKPAALIEAARTAECYKVDGGFVLLRCISTAGMIPFLGVVPEKRRQGIGTALSKFAMDRLARLGAFKVNLYNLNDDLQTRRLLDKFDLVKTFEQVEMRKSFKGRGR